MVANPTLDDSDTYVAIRSFPTSAAEPPSHLAITQVYQRGVLRILIARLMNILAINPLPAMAVDLSRRPAITQVYSRRVYRVGVARLMNLPDFLHQR
ncbi:hypothetical protein TorRG33x02_180870 [Trema orientale]|uniref:Uncharacterized protein n=1 Tax=Trema orientale TaxID=63057 RepID=A0A2P5EKE7_TREOI|nr:hypothetical protein TorRG33x02_180870 [Trema orientale]